MIRLGMINSRLKDFYDIYFYAKNYPFKEEILRKAIVTTCQKRGRELEGMKDVFSKHFLSNKLKNQQWEQFLMRNKLMVSMSFSALMEKIKSFLEPAVEGNERRKWNPKVWSWED